MAEKRTDTNAMENIRQLQVNTAGGIEIILLAKMSSLCNSAVPSPPVPLPRMGMAGRLSV